MKKYIIIILVSFILISVTVYYFASRTTQEEISVSDYIAQADEYFQNKQYSKALEQYKLAINSAPSNTEAYLKASEIYLLKSKQDEALELLRNSENSVTNPDMVHHKIGEILFDNSDLQGALQYFEKAYDENPNNWENTIDLVKIYSYHSDKIDQSIEALNKIDTDDNEGYRWKNYYLALLSYTDIEKSISYLEESSNIDESEIKQRINSLLEVVKKIQSDPEDIVQNDTLLAYEMIKAELYQYAIPLLEKVISENDEYYASYMYLGICYINMDDLDKASENLQKATSTDSDQVQPWIFLAQVYIKQNNQKQTIDTYEEALNIDKENENVRYDYARTLVNFGLFGQAKVEYKKLLDLDLDAANKITYKIELALINLDHLEDYEEGLNLIKEVVEDREGYQAAESMLKAQALDTLGWAFEKNNEKDEALKYLKQSNETYPYNASTYYHLGSIYAEIENYTEAYLNLERAIDLDLEGVISSKASSELENLTNENKDKN